MKFSKFIIPAIVSSMILGAVTTSYAGSIGRSSSSSSSSRSSSSTSASRPSMPSKPSVVPAPASPGGIGGSQGSMGVRKTEVTAPVAQKVEQKRPQPAQSTQPAAGGTGSAPTYGTANQPNYNSNNAPQPGIGAGGVFMSSLGGSLVGSMIGNSLFGHSNHGGGTTVVNNGVPGANSNAAGSSVAGSNGGFVDSGPGGSYTQSVKKEYTMWNFIGDLIGFVVLVALLVGIAWLFYKGFKMVSAYVKRERGITPTQPFNPTQKFWEIQKAFAAADVAQLQTLLGPGLVDEATATIVPSTVTLSKVSHEVVLTNPREFSVHYTFEDNGASIDQVFHYELHEGTWKLNGIETV